MKTYIRYGLVACAAFLIGIFCSPFSFFDPFEKSHTGTEMFDYATNTHPLINPLLSCGDFQVTSPASVKKLEASVGNYLASQVDTGKIIRASVYYRDLNNGPSFGINQNDQFSPGSLLKVPLLIAYYKAAETDPTLLTSKIKIDEGIEVGQIFPPAHPLSELVRHTPLRNFSTT